MERLTRDEHPSSGLEVVPESERVVELGQVVGVLLPRPGSIGEGLDLAAQVSPLLSTSAVYLPHARLLALIQRDLSALLSFNLLGPKWCAHFKASVTLELLRLCFGLEAGESVSLILSTQSRED